MPVSSGLCQNGFAISHRRHFAPNPVRLFFAANRLRAKRRSLFLHTRYDGLGRVTTVTLDQLGLGQLVELDCAYDASGLRTQLSATIDGTQDFVIDYAHDPAGRLVQVQQYGQTGGNAVAEKRVDFTYDAAGRDSTITRYADLAGTELVATTEYAYDPTGRLTELAHRQGATTLAGYTWTYAAAGRIAQFTSVLDGTVDYTHDDTGQLTGADYDYQADESYTYDENGNRIGGSYVIGDNNQLLSDGVYTYQYDAEGNRILRTEIATGHVTEYEWDHRNRLIRVTERASTAGPATQVVEHSYDYLNRWIARAVDTDGAGPLGFDDTYFVYDGTPEDVSLTDRAAVTEDNIGQIVLQFDDDAQGDPQLSHRYLWGDAVDQVLADEQVDDVSVEGDVLWALTDHLGTVCDLAEYDDSTGVTTVANHRTYDAFGQRTSETNAAVDHLFGFTGHAADETTGLQNNLNRWYDAEVGAWITIDPIGFSAADANLYRYVENAPADSIDPSGLWSLWRWIYTGDGNIADEHYNAAREAAGKSYSNNHARTAIRAGAALDPTPVFGTVDSVLTGVEEGQSPLEVAANIGLEAVPGPNPKKGKQAGKVVNKLADGADEAGEAAGKAAGKLVPSKPLTPAQQARAENIAKGIPESQLGPSGKPKIHVVEHSSLKEAKDAARAEVGQGGTTVKHPSPEVGNGHFHGVDRNGDKSRIHHEYPE